MSVSTPVRSDEVVPGRETVFYFAGIPGVVGIEFPELCRALPFNVIGLPCLQLLVKHGCGLGRAFTMANLASHLATAINALQATGPLRLLGFSWGGCVAVATAKVLEDQGREVARLAVVEPFERIVMPMHFAPNLADLWVRMLVPVPPLMGRMHDFCVAQGAPVAPLSQLSEAWNNALVAHATLHSDDLTLHCPTLYIISAYREQASGYDRVENALSPLFPATEVDMSWPAWILKRIVITLSRGGTPVSRSCTTVAKRVAPGDHFFMLDPVKARPALARIADFFVRPELPEDACAGAPARRQPLRQCLLKCLGTKGEDDAPAGEPRVEG